MEAARPLDLTPRSTRKLYPGRHAATVQVNGVVLGRAEFELVTGGGSLRRGTEGRDA